MAVLNRLLMRSRLRWAAVFFAATTAVSASWPCEAMADATSLEDAVKAAFILKFIPFVTWPASAPNTDTFNVCTEGSDTVVDLLTQAAQGQIAYARRIAVKSIVAGAPADDCRIVYIASGMAAGPILQQLAAKPVLTITQSSGPDHGIIDLVTLGKHVSFNIDVRQAASDGITVSSKLLSLAHSVAGAS